MLKKLIIYEIIGSIILIPLLHHAILVYKERKSLPISLL